VFKNVIKKQGGFTLLELLIVIVIIGILALLIIPNITSAPKKARDTQRKTDLKAIQKGLEEYFVSNNAYPQQAVAAVASTALAGDAAGTATSGPLTSGTSPILKKVPVDPKTPAADPFQYAYRSDGATYTLSACLENAADTGEGVGAGTGALLGTCSTKAFTLNNNN
jgi:general secretion pathway protein G